ncbi:hypothetical protein C1H71_20595 (plasmid) [Iodobacter fluviatilis]|uniref:Uncharacterized protein n=1 Tax=Iodobacter fluviatilis TaxID=537 RepID=A0A7G3GEB9_9NEIS|nr:hypothetical protein C1H71_20595 [Iodobacter fluviatilis]
MRSASENAWIFIVGRNFSIPALDVRVFIGGVLTSVCILGTDAAPVAALVVVEFWAEFVPEPWKQAEGCFWRQFLPGRLARESE